MIAINGKIYLSFLSINSAPPKFDFSILRQLRKRDNLTMDTVSQMTGVSIAVISKLERNQTSAEIDTLYRLSRAFNMSTADLMALAELPFAQRESEKNYTSHGFSFRRIRFGNVMALYGQASAGAATSRPEIHHDDTEICWVLEGMVQLKLPHESYRINAGQSLQFDAIMEHTYEALEDSRLLILHLRKDKRY